MLQAERISAAQTSILEAYPGRLVSIGTHTLHLDCRGSGHPIVILESGIGGFSLEWHAVQRSLAAHTRVCTYDRADYGWSEFGPVPRTATRAANELHAPFAVAQPTVSRHLKVLERAGLVRRDVDGRIHRFSLEMMPLKDAEDWIARHEAFWKGTLKRLDEYLVGMEDSEDGQ